MKKKLLLFGGIGTAVVVAAIILVVLLTRDKGYRSIILIEVNGKVSVTRDGQTLDGVPQMKLRSGDGISVPADGYARLKLDDDKYVFLESNTVISLEASGTAAKSRTVIYVEQGKMLTEIQHKLTNDSSYDIVTPNTTMAIRGTITITVVEKDYADPTQQYTEYTGTSFKNTDSSKLVLCWITDNYVVEGQASLTLAHISGEDIRFLTKILRAGNGIHYVTPVPETPGTNYIRKYQVKDVRVFWANKDKRPDTGKGKVVEVKEEVLIGIVPIGYTYAIVIFPKNIDPKIVKGAEGPMNPVYIEGILEYRSNGDTDDPDPDPDPSPSPDPSPEPTPDPTPEPTPDPTPEPTPDPTPEPTPEPNQQGNKTNNNNNNNKTNNNNNTNNNTNTGTQTGDDNGNGEQTGDNTGTETQSGDDNGNGEQTGDNTGTETQTGDDNGNGEQTGDNTGTETQTGDDNGGAVTPIENGENGKTNQPIIEGGGGDNTGDDDDDDDDPVTYTITFHNTTADPTVDVTTTDTYEAGVGVPEFAYPNDTDTHYFDCWLDADGNPVESIPEDATGDIDLYGLWAPRSFNVTFYRFGETFSVEEYTYGEGLSADNFPTEDDMGFNDNPYDKFLGWKDANGNSYTEIGASQYGDINLYADITPWIYSITYMVNGESRTFETKDMSYAAGTGKDYDEFPQLDDNEFYTFLGWSFSENSDVIDHIHSEFTGDVIMYPVWKPRQFTISYYSRGTSLGTETYTFGQDHELRSGTWYVPGNYEVEVTSLNSKDFGDKIYYAKTGIITIRFGSNTETSSYGSAVGIPAPDEGCKWVGINGTTGEYDYYQMVEDGSITEIVCDSDMFFEQQPK